MVVMRLLLIHNNLTWQVYIADHLVPSQCLVLKGFPARVSSEFVNDLIDTISVSNICSGNYEEKFIALANARKGKFLSASGEIVALLDESFCVQLDGVQYSSTVRHRDCHLLIEGLMCTPCHKFRDTLRSLSYKSSQLVRTPSLYTNIRWLKTPQKNARLMSLRRAIKMKNRQLKQLRMKLNVILENDGVQVDEHLQKDLEKIADVHSLVEEDDFKRIFWEQQVVS